MTTQAELDQEVTGIPAHNPDAKFWHTSPDAGKRPEWVDKYKDQGSEYYWDLWANRQEIDIDNLIQVLCDNGWLTPEATAFFCGKSA